MSLISDALKTAQRERTGRGQTGKDPQPLLDGFFPYVSSTPPRSRSRVVPIVGISLATVALLGVAAWVAFMRPERNPGANAKAPIVLPPPVTVSQAPVLVDSTAARPADSEVSAADQPRGEAARAPETPAESPRPRGRVDGGSEARGRTSTAPAGGSITRSPVERSEPSVARVDYEAQATALFNAGDLVGAREKFQLATRFAPTARAWTNYGVTLQRLGDHAGAAAAYHSAIGVDANYLEAWLYQGRLAVDLGDVARATPLFERARSINPRHAELNIEFARLESDAKNWSQTRRFAEEAVRAEPTNSRAHWYLAISADQLRDVEVAIQAYTAYLQTVGAAEREQARYVGWARTRLAALREKP